MGSAWEPIEETMKNTGVTLEPIENIRKTQVIRGNLWKTQGKHRSSVAWEPIENSKENEVLRRI